MAFALLFFLLCRFFQFISVMARPEGCQHYPVKYEDDRYSYSGSRLLLSSYGRRILHSQLSSA